MSLKFISTSVLGFFVGAGLVFFYNYIKETGSSGESLAGQESNSFDPHIGMNFGAYNFTRYDYSRSDSFIEEANTGKMVIPPPVVITKIQGDLVYCYREEFSSHHKTMLSGQDMSSIDEKSYFPDKVWIILNKRKGTFSIYEDPNYKNKIVLLHEYM